MNKLILASSSLGRKKLLDYLNLKYEIIPSHLDEDKIIGKTPRETIRLRARLKGEEVVNKIIKKQSNNLQPVTGNLIILSADSDAILDNKVIGKAGNKKEGTNILKSLSGRTHEFITSVHILKTNQNTSNYKVIYDGETTSLVTFRKIGTEEIRFYLDQTDYTRFAGSYALISAQSFISKVEGSLSNVIGLPLEVIIPILRKLGL